MIGLRLEGETGPVVAVTGGGQVAGSITHPSLAKLIECMQQGFKYVAIVVEVDGGACHVEVRPEGAT